MSKLEELIQKLCPDGVEYKMFPEVCQYIRGITYNKSKEAKTGDLNAHKVLRANNITLSTNTLNFDDVKLVDSSVRVKKEQYLYRGDILICAGSGSKEHIGKVAYISEDLDYTFGGFMAVIRCDKTLMSRFLFHILTGEIFKKYLDMALNSSTINNLNMGIMKDFQIPVPTLEVQQEIVRILDSFTKLTTELTTELTARKQQYEYYRDELLTFDSSINNIELEPLGEICYVVSGGTPSKKNETYWTGGRIKWLGSSVCENQKSVNEITGYITEEGLSNSSAKLMKQGTTLIALVGATIGKVAFLPFEAAINQNIVGLYPINTDKLNCSYLYYACSMLYPKFLQLTQGTKLAMANLTYVRSLQIPVPSIETQEKIVNVLENFDNLCNNLTNGLPAEIEARQKQYEYYRDKLLTFKKLA